MNILHLTRNGPDKAPVYVNAAHIRSFGTWSNKTWIDLGGDPENILTVQESPEFILGLLPRDVEGA